MTISFINKDLYYDLLEESYPYKDYDIYRNISIKFYQNYPYWMLSDNRVFIVDGINNIILIPKKYNNRNEMINLIKESKLSSEIWKISKESDLVPYIRNEFIRNGLFIYERYYYETGSYIINNTINNKSFTVSIMNLNSDYQFGYGNCYVCYDKKIKSLIGSIEIKTLDIFLKILFNEKGQSYKKSYNKSK